METIWLLIEASPAGNRAGLAPGASSEAIRQAESALGLSLPADLKASLARHDGSAAPLGEWRLLSLTDIAATLGSLSAQAVVDDYGMEYHWRPAWLPIGQDAAGNVACLNLDPDTEADDKDFREDIPVDFNTLEEIFVYWRNERRVEAQYVEYREWLAGLR